MICSKKVLRRMSQPPERMCAVIHARLFHPVASRSSERQARLPPVSYTHLDVYKRQIVYRASKQVFGSSRQTDPAVKTRIVTKAMTDERRKRK